MQYTQVQRPSDNRPVTIEVDGEPLGVVVPDAAGFRFLAVRLGAFGIDGEIFKSIDAAQEAASEAVKRAV